MRKDTIIEELHKIRQQHARKFGYDLRKIFTELKQQEEKSSRKFITLPVQRKPAGR